MAQITLRDYLRETEDALQLKRVDEALTSCQYILAYFPESLEAQRLLGEVYLAQGRLEDARNTFDWVLTNDPENVLAYCSRAQVSIQMSDYDTALDCYQQAYELSRDGSRIRQKFNNLSEKSGQPGFMFSRAGLARLYMRGSLLPQAIQEWEIVLALTPDRLDARTGLLETYWRQGLYDRVSQLAEQILHDVPGCLKALLLYAHAIAPQDMLRARDLMQRVIALDPDLLVAHDLFADLKVKQSVDPFLKLLERPPAMVGEPEKTAPTTTRVRSGSSLTATSTSNSGEAFSADKLAAWGSNATWGNESTLVKPHSNTQEPVAPAAQVESPSMPSWMSDEAFSKRYTGPTASRPDLDLGAPGKQEQDHDHALANSPAPAALPNEQADLASNAAGSASIWGSSSWDNLRQETAPQESAEGQAEPWQLLQNALNDMSPEVSHQQSDHGQGENSAQSSSAPSWLSINPFSAPAQEKESDQALPARPSEPQKKVAPPAWLSGLTESEPASLNPVSPADVSSAQPVAPLAEIASAYQPSEPAAVEPPQSKQAEPVQVEKPAPIQPEKPASVDADDDEMAPWARMMQSDGEDDSEEESFFSPDWLRSLGATALDEPEAEQPAPTMRELEKEEEKEKEPQPQPSLHVQKPEPVSMQQPAANAEPAVSQMQTQSQTPEHSTSAWWQETPDHYDPFARPAASMQAELPAAPESNSPSRQEPETYKPQEVQPLEMPQPVPAEPVSAQDNNPWAMLSQQMQDNAIDYSWLEQIAAGQTSATPMSLNAEALPVESETPESAQEQVEQHVITTLEELDERLRSRGFIPMEPNSLASIAQDSDAPADEPLSSESEFPLEEQLETHEEYEEPATAFTESSALAEQGEHYPLERESQPVFTERFASQPRQQKEPSWLTELGFGRGVQPEPEPTFTNFNSVPEPEPVFTNYNPVPEPEPAFTNYNPVPEPVLQPEIPPAVAQGTQPQQKVVAREEQKYQEFQVPQPVSPVRNERSAPPVPMPSFEPAPVRQEQEPQVQRAIPVNPLLDGGLETTMKRPAVRLQPMKQRIMAQELHVTPVQQQKSRSTEHANQPSTEGNVSYRDRLLQGYQAQLIGDYDGAMQEYRVIIRNAPELLSEVVSNVRALLKLAPKYSAGYRVLGDAYMRQGEYLQAMEAYNKALTMAKKAKS